MTMNVAMAIATMAEKSLTTEMNLMMQDMWEDVKMRVPALAPTNLGGACNIMKVQVSVQM